MPLELTSCRPRRCRARRSPPTSRTSWRATGWTATRPRVRPAVAADAAVAGRRVPGRGRRHARCWRACARNTRPAVALPPRRAARQHATPGAPPTTRRRMPLEVMVERRRVRAPRPRRRRAHAAAGVEGRPALPAHARAAAAVEELSRRVHRAVSRLQLPDRQALARLDDEPARASCRPWPAARPTRAGSPRPSQPGGGQPVLDPALKIAAADRAEVRADRARLARLVRRRCSASRPARPTTPGCPTRMEYAVSVAARLSAQPADETHADRRPSSTTGDLDWSSFDLNVEVNLGTDGDRRVRSHGRDRRCPRR